MSTKSKIDSHVHNGYQPPSIVMSTAVTTQNGSDVLTFSWETSDLNSQFYIYMHFAEVQDLQANEYREFDIYLNGQLWFGPLVPPYLITTTIYSLGALNGRSFNVSINQTKNSTLPPIINAIELYTVKDLQESQSNQQDGMFSPLINTYVTCPFTISAPYNFFIFFIIMSI